MAITDLRDYLQYVQTIVRKYGLIQQSYDITKDASRDNLVGVIETGDKFIFRDGAKLEFHERIAFNEGELKRISYSYQYLKADGSYFRYEKDPKREKLYAHSLCHLHVNADDPRYITHETNFEEVFKFILVNFYGWDIDD